MKKLFLLFITLILFSGCEAIQNANMPDPEPEPIYYEYSFIISGTASIANITYLNSLSGLEQYTNASLPFEHIYITSTSIPTLYIRAESLDSTDTTLSITIYSDETMVRYAESSGPYCIVEFDLR